MRTTHGRIHATGVVTAPDEVALGVAGVVATLGVLVELALGADPVHAPRRRAEAVMINTNRVFTIELPLSRFLIKRFPGRPAGCPFGHRELRSRKDGLFAPVEEARRHQGM